MITSDFNIYKKLNNIAEKEAKFYLLKLFKWAIQKKKKISKGRPKIKPIEYIKAITIDLI